MKPRTQRPRYSTAGSNPQQRRHKPDYALSIISLVLLVIGLIVVYAISPGLAALTAANEAHFIQRQLIAIVLAIIVFIIVSRMPLSIWRSLVKPLAALTVLALGATFFFGEEVNNAYRWIQIGGLSFQAVELLKFSIVIWLAFFLGKRQEQGNVNDLHKSIKPIAIVLALSVFVVAVLQSDLGSMGVVVAIVIAMLFASGLSFRWFAAGLVAVFIAGLLLIAVSPYRQDRVTTFLNPQTADCLGEGYQSCQALIAVGSGGMFGKGIDRSAQAYGYLPEAANDSIFAVLAEMFGFLGVVFVIGLFIALFTRLFRIIERAPNNEMRLLVVGVLAWLSTQAFINIMTMVGLFPLTGITLPFISYGGTSIIFVTAAVAIAFNISRYMTYSVHEVATPRKTAKSKGSAHDRAIQRGRNGRSHYAYSIRRP